jgi:hypothetical protein
MELFFSETIFIESIFFIRPPGNSWEGIRALEIKFKNRIW